MITLYTQEEFKNAKSRQPLSLKCEHCGETFYKPKHQIQAAIKNPVQDPIRYCGMKCSGKASVTSVTVSCAQCNQPFLITPSQLEKHKKRGYKNTFCGRVCSTRHTNQHKTTGHHRSKLERWLEAQLIQRYASLNIVFNDSTTIGAELDFYIPSLSLAFELNGVFHYEPIFGQGKLERTQYSDKRKSHLCVEHKIDLCVIDASRHRYFKLAHCQPYLDIMTKIIDERIGALDQTPTG